MVRRRLTHLLTASMVAVLILVLAGQVAVSEPSGGKWVLVETSVNPQDGQTEFIGGGATPGWYTEPRFEGKSTTYAVAETGFSIHDRDVDHGYEYHNVTLQTSFDAPPDVLIPGESVNLTADFSHSGTVNDTNPGVTFWYSGDGVSFQPSTAFGYSPWHPDYAAGSSAIYNFVVPQTHSRGIEIYASWWNTPCCLVIWRYEAQAATPSPQNQDPVCSFTVTPDSPSSRDDVRFQSDSYDPDGDALSYEWFVWDVDADDIWKAGESDSWNWPNPDPGTYEIQLLVDDVYGNWCEYSRMITVTEAQANRDPVCSFVYSPANPTSEDTVVFTSTSSDPDGDPLICDWYVDDVYQDDGESWSWWLPPPCAHAVKLVVSDGEGGSAECSRTVKIGRPCSTVTLEHFYLAGVNSGWARLGMHLGAPDSDIVNWLQNLSAHAKATGLFQDFESSINDIIAMVNRGDSMPEVAQAFDTFEPQLRAQVRGQTCQLSTAGPPIAIEHLYYSGINSGWARLGMDLGAPDSDIIDSLQGLSAHAKATALFENPEHLINEMIAKLNLGVSMPEVARAFDAFEPKLRAQVSGQTCKICETECEPSAGETPGQTTAGDECLLVVTSTKRLESKFGTSGYELIEEAIEKLGATILDAPQNSSFGEVDKLVEGVESNICGILIVGGHDVVPFSELPNPTDDGDILYTDDVYGDFDHDADTIIDLPVARIPDGGDLNLILTQLRGTDTPGPGGFAMGAKMRPWVSRIASIVGTPVLWSAPTVHGDVSLDDVQISYDYFQLHGDKGDTSTWWGDGVAVWPQAFKVHQANSRGIVLTGACYGAYTIGKNTQNSIALAFLRNGARAFVGCTGLHYSDLGNPPALSNGGRFHELFWTQAVFGGNPLDAFYEAKVQYASEAITSVHKKLMHEFVYYGRP